MTVVSVPPRLKGSHLRKLVPENNSAHALQPGPAPAGIADFPSPSERNLVAQRIRAQAGRDKRIGFVSGNFNVLHPGHLRLLKFAAENVDFLVVGVNPDGTPGAAVPAEMRLEGLQSISMVNHAFILNEPPERFIAQLKPEIVVKGKEHQARINPEMPVVEAYGGKLLFSSGEVSFSSLGLLQSEYFETNYSTIRPALDYPERHGFGVTELRPMLELLAGLRVLVIGDLIVDTYITCDPLGMSQEDPTIVVTPIEQKTFVGGAGSVAAHARGLGAEVRYLTVVGADAPAAFARDTLHASGLKIDFFTDETRPTTVKQRYRAHGKTLLRVNHLRQHAVGPDLARAMIRAVERHLPHADLLLFSDFNYGCLPQPIVDAVVERAGERGVVMAADSQASSQLSDISRFQGMTLITPTEREARLALHDFESGLVVLSEQLRQSARAENVVITLGAEGLLVHARDGGTYCDDRLPAFNTAPKDVAGAGDSLFACASLALCAGIDIWRSAYLGALAAACQVSRVGNLPLRREDIEAEIDHVGR
jgi:rfaE bifunctional protein kinase chain/domain